VRAGALALAAATALLLLAGESPWHVFLALVRGAFGTQEDLARTFAGVTPLVFAGLAVAIPYRAGLFNIGAEGQLVLAGLAAGVLGAKLAGVPAGVLLPMTVLAGILAGTTWAAAAGFLKARLGIHEVIVTLLLNFIAWSLADWVLRTPLLSLVEGMEPKTPDVPAGIRVPALIPGLGLGWGLVVAAILAFLLDLGLFRTRAGLALRAWGGNPRAAAAAGVRGGRVVFLAMAAGGGLAGLAGVQQVLVVHGSYVEGFSPGFGFTGIAVALLGGGRPLGVLLAAFFFAVLRSGAFAMDALVGVPRETVGVMEALVILLVASEKLREVAARRRKEKLVEAGT
jgi:simple sugar transport system permease protein